MDREIGRDEEATLDWLCMLYPWLREMARKAQEHAVLRAELSVHAARSNRLIEVMAILDGVHSGNGEKVVSNYLAHCQRNPDSQKLFEASKALRTGDLETALQEAREQNNERIENLRKEGREIA